MPMAASSSASARERADELRQQPRPPDRLGEHVVHLAEPHDRDASRSASRTTRSMVCASAAGGSVVRSTTFIVTGARANGGGSAAIWSTKK